MTDDDGGSIQLRAEMFILRRGDYCVADLYNRGIEYMEIYFHDLHVPRGFVFSLKKSHILRKPVSCLK
jgi:hypothetical protein